MSAIAGNWMATIVPYAPGPDNHVRLMTVQVLVNKPIDHMGDMSATFLEDEGDYMRAQLSMHWTPSKGEIDYDE